MFFLPKRIKLHAVLRLVGITVRREDFLIMVWQKYCKGTGILSITVISVQFPLSLNNALHVYIVNSDLSIQTENPVSKP